MRLTEKLPPHDNLGELVFLEEDEEGDKIYYRQCLKHWSKNEIKKYEEANKCIGFFWQVKGPRPIFGVSAWLLKGEEI